MLALSGFANRYPQRVAAYVSRCDVLKKFQSRL